MGVGVVEVQVFFDNYFTQDCSMFADFLSDEPCVFYLDEREVFVFEPLGECFGALKV